MKEFDPKGSKHDQNSYAGRFRSFMEIIDPRSLFIRDEEITKAKELLQSYEYIQQQDKNHRRLPDNVTDEQLWNAKQIVDSTIHPTTNEKIPAVFRMASFLPANIPLVAGMLHFRSLPGTIFWQWANQSYNSALNYANRSGTEISMSEFSVSYVIAVSVSCTIALSFRIAGKRGPKAWQNFAAIPFVIPFVSVASAGSSNVYFTRRKEINEGIPVFDRDENEVGVSKIAAAQGVYQTILSRSVGLPIPVLVIPYILMKFVPKNISKRPRMIFELAAITLSIALALPATIAIFPQRLELDQQSLELELRDLRDSEGKLFNKLYSNKGL